MRMRDCIVAIFLISPQNIHAFSLVLSSTGVLLILSFCHLCLSQFNKSAFQEIFALRIILYFHKYKSKSRYFPKPLLKTFSTRLSWEHCQTGQPYQLQVSAFPGMLLTNVLHNIDVISFLLGFFICLIRDAIFVWPNAQVVSVASLVKRNPDCQGIFKFRLNSRTNLRIHPPPCLWHCQINKAK